MRRILLAAVLALFVFGATGCYLNIRTPYPALAYYGKTTDTATKVGKATATSILGIIVTGDASLDAATRAAGVTKVHHVDMETTSILGIIATYTTIVYGE